MTADRIAIFTDRIENEQFGVKYEDIEIDDFMVKVITATKILFNKDNF